MHNPILDELHAAREKLLADAGGDLHQYVEEARARVLTSGRPIADMKRTETGFNRAISLSESPLMNQAATQATERDQ